MLGNASFLCSTMRNFNSSLVPWIGIIIISSLWFACYAHPDGGIHTNSIHLLKRRDVNYANTGKDDLSFNFPRRSYYPPEEKITLDIRNVAKRHVSITMKTIKTILDRDCRTSSIDEKSLKNRNKF